MQIQHLVEESLLNMRLVDMRCKHALRTSERAKTVIRLSNLIGYDIAEWGLHSNHVNIKFHADVIMKMEEDDYRHPERIVVCKYAFYDKPCVWVDNLHSAIRYVRKYGIDAKVRDIPFYVVDISGDELVLSEQGTGILDMDLADGAVLSAYARWERSNLKELIELHYTLGEFLSDNPILLTCTNYFDTDGATRGAKIRKE